jgi:hypothetical protein
MSKALGDAKPNELDTFKTYTYHFELHAAPTWKELLVSEVQDLNRGTSRTQSQGTLLINTRQDAHQNITKVSWHTSSTLYDPQFVNFGNLTMEIVEPKGMFFVEKLLAHAEGYQVGVLQSGLIFGLKVFFVGQRDAANQGKPETIQMQGMIPLHLMTVEGSFDYKGGTYKLQFGIDVMRTGFNLGSTPLSMVANSRRFETESVVHSSAMYTNSNITLKAKTVQDAVAKLEKKLNENYELTYLHDLKNSFGERKLRYVIKVDPRFYGDLDLITTVNSAPGSEVTMTFNLQNDIVYMVWQILLASKHVNEIIGSNKDKIKKQLHEGVILPSFVPLYYMKDDEVVVGVEVKAYTGLGARYAFDYYFTEAGANVDILALDVKFAHLEQWLATKSTYGANHSTNFDRSIPVTNPDFHAQNNLHEDSSRDTLKAVPSNPQQIPTQQPQVQIDAARAAAANKPTERAPPQVGVPSSLITGGPAVKPPIRIPGEALGGGVKGPITKSNDVALLAPVIPQDQKGYIAYKPETIASKRLAFETMSLAGGAVETKVSMIIRGHLGILELCFGSPDPIAERYPLGVLNGLWVKVKILQDGEEFFYTGFYAVMQIENIFTDGKFTQVLHMTMMEEQAPTNLIEREPVSVKNPGIKTPGSSSDQPPTKEARETPEFVNTPGGAAVGRLGETHDLHGASDAVPGGALRQFRGKINR